MIIIMMVKVHEVKVIIILSISSLFILVRCLYLLLWSFTVYNDAVHEELVEYQCINPLE